MCNCEPNFQLSLLCSEVLSNAGWQLSREKPVLFTRLLSTCATFTLSSEHPNRGQAGEGSPVTAEQVWFCGFQLLDGRRQRYSVPKPFAMSAAASASQKRPGGTKPHK